jgi:hypothetical protein
MQSAVKNAKQINDQNIHNVSEVMARRRIMPTPEGFAKAADKARVLRRAAYAKAREAQKAGQSIDPSAITRQMDRETGRLSAIDPTGQRYVDANRTVRDDFWSKHSVPTQEDVPLEFAERTGTGFDVTTAPLGAGTAEATNIQHAPIDLASQTGTGWLDVQAIRRPAEIDVPRTSTTMDVQPAVGAPADRFAASPNGFAQGPQTTETHLLREGPREAKPLSVRRSMAITERLNSRLPHGKSDPLSLRPPPTPVEDAEHTLAQAIRAARERAAPGMNDLNQQRGELLSVMKQLQNYTLNRAGNAEPIPFRALYGIGIGGGLAAAGQGIGAVAGGTALPLIVNSPRFKARTGIALYHGDAGLDALGKMGRAGAQNLTRAAVGEDLVRDAIMQAMQQNTEIP